MTRRQSVRKFSLACLLIEFINQCLAHTGDFRQEQTAALPSGITPHSPVTVNRFSLVHRIWQLFCVLLLRKM